MNFLHPKKYKNLLYGWFIFAVATLFYCYEYLLRIAPGAMTSNLREAFGGLSLAALGGLVACYYYVYTPMQLIVGVLTDRIDPKYLLSFACLMCVIGTYLFVFADHVFIAAIGRGMTGFGSAFVFVGVLALAATWLPGRNFGLATGLAMFMGMVAGMLGSVLLTKLIGLVGWRNVLIYAGHTGILLTLILYFFIPKRKPRLGSKLKFSFQDLRKDLFGALKNRQLLLAGCVNALLYLSLSAFAELWGISYFEMAYGLEKLAAAKAISMVFLGWALGAPLVGYISDRLKRQVIPMIACSIAATIFSALFLLFKLPYEILLVCMFLYGFFCSANILSFSVGIRNSSKKQQGVSIATVNMIGVLGGMIAQPLIGKLLDFLLAHETIVAMGHSSTAMAYTIALSVLPAGALLAAFLAFFIKKHT